MRVPNFFSRSVISTVTFLLLTVPVFTAQIAMAISPINNVFTSYASDQAALLDAQQQLATAQATATSALQTLNQSKSTLQTANADLQTANQTLTDATTTQNISKAEVQSAQNTLSSTQAIYDIALSNNGSSLSKLASAKQAVAQAQAQLATAQSTLDTNTTAHAVANTEVQLQQQKVNAFTAIYLSAVNANSQAQASLNQAIATQAKAQAVVDRDLQLLNQSDNKVASAQLTLTVAQMQADQVAYQLIQAQDRYSIAQSDLQSKTDAQVQAYQVLQQAQALYEQSILDHNYKAYLVQVYQSNLTKALDDELIAQQGYAEASSQASITQSNLDQMQAILDQKTQELSVAQANYDYAYQQALASAQGIAGLHADIYNQLTNQYPARSTTAYHFCKSITLPNIQANWGGGDILGCGSDFVMIHYYGYLTPITTDTYWFMNQADDGFFMTLDGQTVISDWRLKGCGGGWGTPISLTAGTPYAIDAWFYEWGGGACSTLYYQNSTNWGVIPTSWFTQDSPTPAPIDPAIVTALQEAQAAYNTALGNRNSASTENNIAQGNKQTALTNYQGTTYTRVSIENTLASAQQEEQQAQLQLDQSTTDLETAQANFDQATIDLATAQQEFDSATLNLNNTVALDQQAKTDLISAQYALTVAESELQQAQGTYATDLVILQDAQSSTDLAQYVADATLSQTQIDKASLDDAQRILQALILAQSVAISQLVSAQASYDSALKASDSATISQQLAQSAYDQAVLNLQLALQNLQADQASLTSATTNEQITAQDLVNAQRAVTTATTSVATATAQVTTDQATYDQAVADVATAQALVDSIIPIPDPIPTVDPTPTPTPTVDPTPTIDPTPTPIPTPTPTPDPVVPTPVDPPKVVLPPLDDLTKVDLKSIVATDLTPKQAEQLKEAALETFKTADAGSPAYEAALDALLVAAQQDDIVLPEDLAAIPGAAALVDAINLISNVGADMSPKVREETQKATVAAVIVGQVAGAAMTATASASSSSSSGSGSRKTEPSTTKKGK